MTIGRSFARCGRAIAVGAFCAGLMAAPVGARAATCTIESKGGEIYLRLKQTLEAKFGADTDVKFPPYNAIHTEMKPGCLLEMTGLVDLTRSRVEQRRPFIAEVEDSPDDTGWRIVTLKVGN
jgi:hypothetical protein